MSLPEEEGPTPGSQRLSKLCRVGSSSQRLEGTFTFLNPSLDGKVAAFRIPGPGDSEGIGGPWLQPHNGQRKTLRMVPRKEQGPRGVGAGQVGDMRQQQRDPKDWAEGKDKQGRDAKASVEGHSPRTGWEDQERGPNTQRH